MDKCLGTKDICGLRLWRSALAEFIGTLFLTLIGCGTCLGSDWESAPTPTTVQISLAFGLIVGAMVWCIGHVSGGHINPAITVAFLVTRRISFLGAIVYILSQMTGAVFGAGILAGVSRKDTWGSLGRTSVDGTFVTPSQGFWVELLITFVLVFTVFASCDSKRSDLNGSTPLTIGFSVTVCHLFAIKYTGSSMNPARSFGPAMILSIVKIPKHLDPTATDVFNGTTASSATEYINGFENHWVYWLGPILGGILAGLLYEFVFAVNASVSRSLGMLTKCPFDREDKTDAETDGHELRKV